MAKLKTKKIPLTRQPQDRWYEVDMQFSIDTGMKTMDDLLKQCRMDDTLPTVQNAGVVNVKQVIPFVPDDDYIAKVAGFIVNSTKDPANKTDVIIRSAKFIGYKSFYAIEPPDSEDQEEPNVQAQIPVNPAAKEESTT